MSRKGDAHSVREVWRSHRLRGTLTEARDRGILGVSGGSFYAIYAAFSRPDVFGGAAVQTLFLGNLESRFKEMIASGQHRDLKLYIAIAKFDHENSKKASHEIVELLNNNGYQPEVDEVGDGVGWGSWGSRTDRMLKALFP